MVRVVGIDHLVVSVSDFDTSKSFYAPLMEFLGFGVEAEYEGMMGWANGETLFWIAGSSPAMTKVIEGAAFIALRSIKPGMTWRRPPAI